MVIEKVPALALAAGGRVNKFLAILITLADTRRLLNRQLRSTRKAQVTRHKNLRVRLGQIRHRVILALHVVVFAIAASQRICNKAIVPIDGQTELLFIRNPEVLLAPHALGLVQVVLAVFNGVEHGQAAQVRVEVVLGFAHGADVQVLVVLAVGDHVRLGDLLAIARNAVQVVVLLAAQTLAEESQQGAAVDLGVDALSVDHDVVFGRVAHRALWVFEADLFAAEASGGAGGLGRSVESDGEQEEV